MFQSVQNHILLTFNKQDLYISAVLSEKGVSVTFDISSRCYQVAQK